MNARWLLIAILAVPLVLVGPTRAAQTQRGFANTNPATFVDTQNDGGTAPDIRTVVASNDTAGAFKFRINVSKLTFPSNVLVSLALDTDQNAGTGSGGFDYTVVCDESNDTVVLRRWDGSQFVPASAPTLSASDDAAGVTITLNRTDIGNTSALNLRVETSEGGGGPGHQDFAPDSGAWSYALTAPLTLSLASFKAPGTVSPGKSFLVRMLVKRSDTGEFVSDENGGAVSCRATVGGKPLRAKRAGFMETTSPEQAACLWRAPTKANRKTIRGSITISIDGIAGVTAKHTFIVRVRAKKHHRL